MADKKRKDITMEGVELIFRNFSGKEGDMNPKGRRNFCVLLDDDVASAMASDGFNIKQLKPREEGDTPRSFVKINVNFDSAFPPRLYLITARGKTLLEPEDMPVLDWTQLTNVDLIANPSEWKTASGSGVSLYLKSGYFTIYEDELDLKYADLEVDSAKSGIVRGTIDADDL
jgi:hypothetical protein